MTVARMRKRERKISKRKPMESNSSVDIKQKKIEMRSKWAI